MSQAQTPNSRGHSQVISFLRKRNDAAAERAARRDATTATTTPPTTPEADAGATYTSSQPKQPLLTRVSGPDEDPEYLGKPRPINSPTRKRRIPTLCADSYGQPFLRYKKPHPPLMDDIVRKKRTDWIAHIEKVGEADDYMIPEAILEDRWDDLMEEQLVKEGLQPIRSSQREPSSEKFLWTALLVKMWSEWRLEIMWQDWAARGAAMQQLVQDERALVEAENSGATPEQLKAMLEKMSQRKRNPLQEKRNLTKAKRFSNFPQVQVQIPNQGPSVENASDVREEYREMGWPTEATNGEPYSSPIWAALVQKRADRLDWKMEEAKAIFSADEKPVLART